MVIEFYCNRGENVRLVEYICECNPNLEGISMWTVVIVLLVLWALGFGFAGSTLGWLIHVLLVVAVVLAIINLLRGRSAV